MKLTTKSVLDAFRSGIQHARAQVPLRQAEVKLVTALTVDLLCAGLTQKPARLHLFANRLQKYEHRFRNSKLVAHESILDVAVYSGATDPFQALFTAESEAFSGHVVGFDEDSESSGYLWDLFKLIQVPSPHRLFVARVVGRNHYQLDQDVQRTVAAYPERFAEGDQIFALVLPTRERDYVDVVCRGWRAVRRSLESLPHAQWT